MEDDLTQEILFGTPDMTAEEEQQLRLQAEQTAQDMQIMESMAQQQMLQQEAAAQQPQRSQQQSAQPTGQAQQQEEQQGGIDIGGLARQTLEGAMTVPAGILDFGVDLINILPSKEVPGIDNPFRPGGKAQKLPKFQSDIMQTLREISSVVAPTIILTKLGGGALASTASASKLKMLQDPFVKWVGPKLFAAGVGAGVDYTAEINQTDDNLSGTLKKNFPAQFGWIPNDIATLDSDSPDVKRQKSVVEGTGIGVFGDFVEGMGKLVKGIRGVVRSTQWVPESEKAKNWFSKNLGTETADDIEEAIAESAARRSDALDELGEYNFSKNANLDEPMLGVHDLYGYEESGIRSVDPLGIVGAAVDYTRIATNADSVYGRVGSVISEPALKFGLEVPEGMETIIKGLASQLQDAGEYGYRTASGKYLSHKEIMQAGEDLAMDFYKMDTPELQRAIKNWQGIDVDTGAPVLKSEAYAAVFKTINRYMDDFANMDVMRAQAYVGTSFAGQVSDMAQGVRLMDGTAAIERAEEQILDRLEFLMAQKGMTSYSRGRALNMLNLWNRLTVKGSEAADAGYATKINNAIKGEENATLQAIERIKGEAKQTINTLREIKAERPEMLAPLMMAYEFTDGKVDTISKLNNYVRNSLGVFSKAFFDGEPEIPSTVMRGFWSNVYNSTLSAIGTPTKAGVSNIALLAERPIAQAAGAIINGDMTTFRKGWYQYSAAWDTLTNSLGYMNQVFRRSASEPYVMALREDMGVADRQQIELLKQFADAKAESGEYGPQIMMSIVEAQNDLAQHPWLRFGQRGMQAFDGFTQAVIANWEARGKAWDTVTKGGLIPLDKKASDQLSKEVYSAMFDENDNITDSAVRYASSEISMALDNPANDALSGLIRTAPILKPFLLFTKTPLNMATYFGSHNPVGAFIDQINAFDKQFAEMSGQEVEQLLSSRGIDYGMENIESVYNTIRAELKGRKAIGTLAVMGAVGLFMADNLTGDGLYDKEKQRLRRDANWQPRSIRVPGAGWVSYDGIPGVSDWVALTANIMDNFDSLNSAELAENLRAAGFVLSATITDKSMLAALEPLNDVVRGDVGAINRWTSSFASSAAMPGSSLMAEFGRLITPNKKELENNFFDLVANRNPIMKQALPDAHDWIDGGLVGEPPNFFARVWNTYLPWKVNGEVSPEKQFLMDIEYDARPTLKTNGRGVEYSNEERSEVTSMMGKQQIFKREIQRIMQTEEGNVFRKEFKKARDMGLQPEVEKFRNIHLYLDAALRSSMRYAEAQVSTRDGIQQKVYKNQTVENFLQVGDLDGAKRFLDNMKQTMSY
jgi:hypothetical protein